MTARRPSAVLLGGMGVVTVRSTVRRILPRAFAQVFARSSAAIVGQPKQVAFLPLAHAHIC